MFESGDVEEYLILILKDNRGGSKIFFDIGLYNLCFWLFESLIFWYFFFLEIYNLLSVILLLDFDVDLK